MQQNKINDYSSQLSEENYEVTRLKENCKNHIDCIEKIKENTSLHLERLDNYDEVRIVSDHCQITHNVKGNRFGYLRVTDSEYDDIQIINDICDHSHIAHDVGGNKCGYQQTIKFENDHGGQISYDAKGNEFECLRIINDDKNIIQLSNNIQIQKTSEEYGAKDNKIHYLQRFDDEHEYKNSRISNYNGDQSNSCVKSSGIDNLQLIEDVCSDNGSNNYNKGQNNNDIKSNNFDYVYLIDDSCNDIQSSYYNGSPNSKGFKSNDTDYLQIIGAKCNDNCFSNYSEGQNRNGIKINDDDYLHAVKDYATLQLTRDNSDQNNYEVLRPACQTLSTVTFIL